MSDTQTIADLQAKIRELESKIRYGLVWEDKPEKVEIECKTKIPILTSVPSLDVPPSEPSTITLFDDPSKASIDHLLIEADNLHALTVMQYTHAGRIDVIYIDPPYNTGNKDFVYNDRYVDKDNTFRHSMWLSFMSKRLELAKNLLSDKGVIFMSIGDDEFAQLKLLSDKIFGEDNYVANFVWKRRTSSAMTTNMCSTDHEYILCYQKTSNYKFVGVDKSYDSYTNIDNDPLGSWTLGDLTVGMGRGERPNQFYDLVDPKTGNIFKANPNRVWSYIPESMQKKIAEGRVYFPTDITKKPMLKRYKTDLQSEFNPISTWIESSKSKTDGITSGLNTEATKELQDIFGENVFNYAKPKSLIKSILKASSQPDSIILDFMAGSGTTGQAVLELNKEDGGTRQCILITNNESNGVGGKLLENEKPKIKSQNSDLSEAELQTKIDTVDIEQFGICRRVTQPRMQKIIEGYTNSKGIAVEPLSGNKLRYFKSSWVELVEDMEDDTMLTLSENALEVLKVKENCFDFVDSCPMYWNIARSHSKLLAIYYSEDMSKLEVFKAKVEECLSFQGSEIATVCVYIFGFAIGQFNDFFDNNSQITVKDFPEPMLRVLSKVKN